MDGTPRSSFVTMEKTASRMNHTSLRFDQRDRELSRPAKPEKIPPETCPNLTPEWMRSQSR